MNWLLPAIVSTLTGSLLLATVYIFLYYQEKERFLGVWAVGWLVYIVRFVAQIAQLLGGEQPITSFLQQAASALNGLFLIWGAYMMNRWKLPRWVILGTAVSLAWAAGAISMGAHDMWVALPNYTYLGVLYIWTGVLLMRMQHIYGNSRKLTGWAFILWGLHKLNFPFLSPIDWIAPWGYLLGAALGVTVALSMLLMYFQKTSQDLEQSEERFRKAFHTSPDAVNIKHMASGRFTEVNEGFLKMTGFGREDVIGRTTAETNIFANPNTEQQLAAALDRDGSVQNLEAQFHTKDGSLRTGLVSSSLITLDGQLHAISIMRDIQSRVDAERALRESEDRYQLALQGADLGTWDILLERGELVISPGWRELLDFPDGAMHPDEALWDRYIHPDDRQEAISAMRAHLEGQTGKYEVQHRIRMKNGNWHWVLSRGRIVERSPGGKPRRISGTLLDVNDRVQAELALRQSEQHLRTLIEQAPVGIATINMRGDVTDVNPVALQILGSPGRAATLQLNVLELPTMISSGARDYIQHVLQHGEGQEFELGYTSVWGKELYLRTRIAPLFSGKDMQTGALLIIEDATDRKQFERQQGVMIKILKAVRGADTRSDMLEIVLDEIIHVLPLKGALLVVQDAENPGQLFIEKSVGIAKDVSRSSLSLPGELIPGILAEGKPVLFEPPQVEALLEPLCLQGAIQSLVGVPLVARHEPIGVLWAGGEIPLNEAHLRLITAIGEVAAIAIQRATLYEETKRRLQRLSAVHIIDQAISASLDLSLFSDVFLHQVLSQLQVHAACIAQYNQHTQSMQYIAGRGFSSRFTLEREVRLQGTLAGKLALERKTIAIPNIARRESPSDLLLTPPSGDEFNAYFGVPLISKGELKGILEVYNHTALHPSSEWLEFLETLAGQAAIAMDNMVLFDNLQRSNAELILAYDTTLEGWARALELRDQETQGHTLRVTDATVKLAAAMGFDEDELAHIRRGAMLHDIGKMAIPDSILLKPGSLNEQEWEVMKHHPLYAYEMLARIPYLRKALNIPHYHHEKWDGSGYPEGLQGENIPLEARIFTVIDVWDALSSDRPYRKAWSSEEVKQYIRQQSGAHFDPQVVAAFFDVLIDPQEH